MKPLFYGYMRVAGDMTHEDVTRAVGEITAFAVVEGFALQEIFIDTMARPRSAFSSLVDALKQSEVRDVIVPSLWHFACLPGLQEAMTAQLRYETGARIWVVKW